MRAFLAKIHKNSHFFQINILLVWVSWVALNIIERCGVRAREAVERVCLRVGVVC